MDKLSLNEAARAVGGTADKNTDVTGVFTDSRKPLENGLFIALTGDRFDGHDYVKSLENSGASAVLVEKDVSTSLPKILVKDTRSALGALAFHQRSKTQIPVIGLTGSVGKTTTKEMIWYVLSSKYNTLKTEGNLNNDIGMPLTLLRLDSSYEAAVIEMGMNHSGELSRLTHICRPTASVITNIGMNHIENLGSQENIFKAKLEITEGMRKDSYLFVNGDDRYLGVYENPNFKIIRFGINSDKNDVMAYDINSESESVAFFVRYGDESVPVYLPCAGIHNVYNALCAIAVGVKHGISLRSAANALKNYVPAGMRQRIIKHGGVTVIEDCYNASPDSVKASLKVLSAYKNGKRIAVLGDMLELGDFSEQLHREVGRAVKDSGVSILLTYGNLSRFTADEAMKCGVDAISFDSREKLCEAAGQLIKENDTVLIKGSRGMHMEKIYETLFSDKT